MRSPHLEHVILVAEGKGLLKFLLSCDHTPCPFTFHWPEQISWLSPVSVSFGRNTAVYKAIDGHVSFSFRERAGEE